MKSSAENNPRQAGSPEKKKPYQTPKVTELGTISDLTQATAGNPGDGGGTGNEGSIL